MTWEGTNRDELALPHLPPAVAGFSGGSKAILSLLALRVEMLWRLRAWTSLTLIALSSNLKASVFPSLAAPRPISAEQARGR